MTSAVPSLAAGTVFNGRYQIVRCLRAGGMGAVYEVLHLETRRRRAMKVMLPELLADDELRSRFRLEATVAAEIESDHIVETLDAGVDGHTGAPYLVMELLRGRDLGDVMRERRLAPAEVALLLGQAALALEKTHKAGIIHRDLKPENLFLTSRDDRTPRLKILDFGIAKVVQKYGKATMTQAVGTPPYMAPEQIEGAPTLGPRTDLYALAHIAYALLVGAPYFGEDNALAILSRVLKGPVEKATERAARAGVVLAPGFDAWFKAAASVNPDERFSNASTMIGMLAFALGVEAFRGMGGASMSAEELALALDQTQADSAKSIATLLVLKETPPVSVAASVPGPEPVGPGPVPTGASFARTQAPRQGSLVGVFIGLGIATLVLLASATLLFIQLRKGSDDDARSPAVASSVEASSVVRPPLPVATSAMSAPEPVAPPPVPVASDVVVAPPPVVTPSESSAPAPAASPARPPKAGRSGPRPATSSPRPTEPPPGFDPTRMR